MKTKEVILRDALPKDCVWDEPHNAVGEWKLVNTPSVYVRDAMGEYAKQCLLQAVERIKEKIAMTKVDNQNEQDLSSYIAGLDSACASIRQLLKELE